MAGHSNAKKTGRYDRRNDDITVEEAERIGISMLKTAGRITRGALVYFPEHHPMCRCVVRV
jgi:hypothetical protein